MSTKLWHISCNHFLLYPLLYCKLCKCDWTDTGAKQGFSQLIAFIIHHIVELCRENIGKIPYWLSLFKKQGLSQTQQ